MLTQAPPLPQHGSLDNDEASSSLQSAQPTRFPSTDTIAASISARSIGEKRYAKSGGQLKRRAMVRGVKPPTAASRYSQALRTYPVAAQPATSALLFVTGHKNETPPAVAADLKPLDSNSTFPPYMMTPPVKQKVPDDGTSHQFTSNGNIQLPVGDCTPLLLRNSGRNSPQVISSAPTKRPEIDTPKTDPPRPAESAVALASTPMSFSGSFESSIFPYQQSSAMSLFPVVQQSDIKVSESCQVLPAGEGVGAAGLGDLTDTAAFTSASSAAYHQSFLLQPQVHFAPTGPIFFHDSLAAAIGAPLLTAGSSLPAVSPASQQGGIVYIDRQNEVTEKHCHSEGVSPTVSPTEHLYRLAPAQHSFFPRLCGSPEFESQLEAISTCALAEAEDFAGEAAGGRLIRGGRRGMRKSTSLVCERQTPDLATEADVPMTTDTRTAESGVATVTTVSKRRRKQCRKSLEDTEDMTLPIAPAPTRCYLDPQQRIGVKPSAIFGPPGAAKEQIGFVPLGARQVTANWPATGQHVPLWLPPMDAVPPGGIKKHFLPSTDSCLTMGIPSMVHYVCRPNRMSSHQASGVASPPQYASSSCPAEMSGYMEQESATHWAGGETNSLAEFFTGGILVTDVPVCPSSRSNDADGLPITEGLLRPTRRRTSFNLSPSSINNQQPNRLTEKLRDSFTFGAVLPTDVWFSTWQEGLSCQRSPRSWSVNQIDDPSSSLSVSNSVDGETSSGSSHILLPSVSTPPAAALSTASTSSVGFDMKGLDPDAESVVTQSGDDTQLFSAVLCQLLSIGV